MEPGLVTRAGSAYWDGCHTAQADSFPPAGPQLLQSTRELQPPKVSRQTPERSTQDFASCSAAG